MPKSDTVTRVHKRIAALLAASLLLSISVLPASAAGTGWYTVRAKNHAQPVADPALREVEKHGGFYLDHTHADPNASDKVIYLTFDAGYENGNVEKILDTLKAEGATGAFFILGNLPASHPELVRRMAAEGHLVCNHTYTHKNLCGASPGALTSELKRLEDACAAIGVEVSKYYRPPEGCFDIPMLEEAQAAGYRTVFWSFAYADWDTANQPEPNGALDKILSCHHDGAIYLLHAVSATNAQVLGDVIDGLRNMGYTLELLK
jgi:peptidoglycan-N-acetylmuramic acid deacetylase